MVNYISVHLIFDEVFFIAFFLIAKKKGGGWGRCLQCFFLDGNQEKNIPSLQLGLHLNFNVVTLQPFDHKLILLAWREPGPDRFPRPATADAAVFRLGNPDQTFLRCCVHRMMINFKAPLKLPLRPALPWQ